MAERSNYIPKAMLGRQILVVGIASLIAVQIVRNAVVANYADSKPDVAGGIWKGHPAAEISQALVSIAQSARSGSPADKAAFSMVDDAALKSPLSAEPFLVHGVQARLDGNGTLAGNAFRAAELRDGRSVPARYFLADYYLTSGDVARGLREIAILARMIPTGVAALSPYVASFARDAHHRAQLKALFQSEPLLEDSTLSVLAAEPGNSDLILQLATPAKSGPAPSWPNRLVSSLIADHDYAKAYQVWRTFGKAHASPGSLIYDASFEDANSPPPFNWTLTSSALGVAERAPGGKLHVVYDGADDGVLAWQLLLLKPGHYRIAMRATGDFGAAGSLTWTLSCADSSVKLLTVRLAPKVQTSFVIPSGCAAQRLELAGAAPNIPDDADVTISDLTLNEERSGG